MCEFWVNGSSRVSCREYVNSHANFENFINALLTLVRVTTNDDWAGLVEDLAVKPPHCDQAAGSCGQNYFITAGFFGTFVMLNTILMLNLFATIIIQCVTTSLCLHCNVWKCCLLYTSPSPRDRQKSRMPSSA